MSPCCPIERSPRRRVAKDRRTRSYRDERNKQRSPNGRRRRRLHVLQHANRFVERAEAIVWRIA